MQLKEHLPIGTFANGEQTEWARALTAVTHVAMVEITEEGRGWGCVDTSIL